MAKCSLMLLHKQEKTMAKILMVEDDLSIARSFARNCEAEFGNKVELLHVSKLRDAEDVFRKRKDELAAILMDGCVETRGDHADTLPLLREIKASGFAGPVIANSLAESNRRLMLEAGATHWSDKTELFETMARLLGLDIS